MERWVDGRMDGYRVRQIGREKEVKRQEKPYTDSFRRILRSLVLV